MSTLDRLPLTYDECRTRFRRAAEQAGCEVESHPIAARGPDGQALSVDVVALGADRPQRALVLLSGVHGVEGFIGSALQCDLLGRLDVTKLPPDMAVVVVHAVNPWGMAWWRRQNESNVDLNRNWRRSEVTPVHNDPYDVVHPLACPDTPDMPSVEGLLVSAQALVDEHGFEWIRDAITMGQYRRADGLHFGGDVTEESTQIVQDVATTRLTTCERMFTLDLHTGHGPHGEITCLSDEPPGSPQDHFLRTTFPTTRVEATADNPDATTGSKSGQIANGIAQVVPGAECFATSMEFGTASDEEQLVATYLEHWVHHHGDRDAPAGRAATWAYRCCFTPDDREWERTCLSRGAAQLDAAVSAVADWA